MSNLFLPFMITRYKKSALITTYILLSIYKTHKAGVTVILLRCNSIKMDAYMLMFRITITLLLLTDNLAIEEVNDAMGVGSVVLRVRHHDNRGAFFIELCEYGHDFFTILGIKITCGLIG